MRLKLMILFSLVVACTALDLVAPVLADSVAAVSDAGVSAAVVTPPAAPVAPPVNPVANPAGYISELAQARASGWGVLLLVVVFGVCELAAASGKDVPALMWLGSGRVSIVIGGGVAVTAAALAALASAGTWTAAGYAAIGAALLYLHPAAVDVAIAKTARGMKQDAVSGKIG